MKRGGVKCEVSQRLKHSPQSSEAEARSANTFHWMKEFKLIHHITEAHAVLEYWRKDWSQVSVKYLSDNPDWQQSYDHAKALDSFFCILWCPILSYDGRTNLRYKTDMMEGY